MNIEALNEAWSRGLVEYDAMRLAAQHEFGIPGEIPLNRFAQGDLYPSHPVDVALLFEERCDRYRREMREVYEMTQRGLAEAKIPSMYLYRGVGGTRDNGKVFAVTSWSELPEQARLYAWRGGHVIERLIPADRILSVAAHGGLGHAASFEVVVLSAAPASPSP